MQGDVSRGIAIATTIHDPLGPISQGRELLREAIYLQEVEASKARGSMPIPGLLADPNPQSSFPQAPRINLLDIKVNLAMQRASNDVQYHDDSVDRDIYLEEIHKASAFEA